MTSIALHTPFPPRSRTGRWVPHWLRTRLRFHRRARFRRTLLAQVLAETSYRRAIEEAGFRVPGPSMLELWAESMLRHR